MNMQHFSFKRRPALLFGLFLLLPSVGLGANWKAQIERPSKTLERIQGLSWGAEELPIHFVSRGLESRPTVRLKGTFDRLQWDLFLGQKRLNPSELWVDVPLTGTETEIEFSALGPAESRETEKLIIRFAEWNEAVAENQRRPEKRSFLFSSIGPTAVSYKEAGKVDYSMIALTGKISYQFLMFPPNWDLALNAFANLVPISKSSDKTARFVGANLRFGYAIPALRAPWRLSLLGGWYYTRMFVTDDSFGYKNMVWPQLFPVLSRELNNGDVLTASFKFAPMMDKLKLLPLSNREVGVGLTWQHLMSNDHPLSVNLDIAHTRLNANNLDLNFATYSISLGYGW